MNAFDESSSASSRSYDIAGVTRARDCHKRTGNASPVTQSRAFPVAYIRVMTPYVHEGGSAQLIPSSSSILPLL